MSGIIRRQRILDKIIPFIDNELIKVITGVRRSGKTQLLTQIIEELYTRGVSQSQIISINFESMKYRSINTSQALYDYVCNLTSGINGKVYLFLDEIQQVKDWEEAINSFRVDFDCDIYITGSNSKLLSGELATYIAGRYITIEVSPFTFAEAKEYALLNGSFESDAKLFAEYIKYGGFPQRFQLNTEESIYTFLNDIYDSIVLKDVIDRNKISNVKILQSLCSYLLDNVALQFSANSISKKLKAENISASVDTILNYISYIQNAYIIQGIKRYDITGKKLLEVNDKFYSCDLGLCTIARTSEKIDYTKVFENIVYLELKANGWNVNIGKLDNKEIDFIACKENKKIYIQVAYLINEHDIEREFGNLEKIADAYPKYVISSDIVDLSRNGIIHKNIIDWLLEDKK